MACFGGVEAGGLQPFQRLQRSAPGFTCIGGQRYAQELYAGE